MSVRWNSTLIMARRLIEQRAAIDRVAMHNQNLELTLTINQWLLLEQLVKLLTEFERASLMFCKSPISTQIPYAHGLVRALEEQDLSVVDLREPNPNPYRRLSLTEMEEVRQKFIMDIKEKFFILEEKRFILEFLFNLLMFFSLTSMATFLDPRFKNKFYTNKELIELKFVFFSLFI